MDSCHHKPWLVNTLREQFICLRGNCTTVSDYLDVDVSEKRFTQKGYIRDKIRGEIEMI